jgi:phosphatidylglycerophosphate synthase
MSRRFYTMLALLGGVVLFVVTLAKLNLSDVREAVVKLTPAAPWIVLVSGVWQALRVVAWRACFPAGHRPGLINAGRIRLAGEAFSFLTVWGVVGEPLKVLLLHDTPPATTTAALALERAAYLAVTITIVGVSGMVTSVYVDLGPAWTTAFRAVAAGSAIAIAAAILVARRRRASRQAPPAASAGESRRRRIARFVFEVERELVNVAATRPSRLVMLAALYIACHVCMVAEVWLVLRAVGITPSLAAANAVETVTRVVSFFSSVIPGNLGALEASNVAAAAAVGAGAGGGALAIARRLRGLLWAAIGLIVLPSRRARTTDEPALAYLAEPTDRDASPFERVVSLPIAERVVRAAAAAGYRQVHIWMPSDSGRMSALVRSLGLDVNAIVLRDVEEWRRAMAARCERPITVVPPGTIVSTSILRSAIRLDAAPVDVPAGEAYAISGVMRVRSSDARDVGQLVATVAARLEQRRTPSVDELVSGAAMLAMHLRSRMDVRGAEEVLERATYKPTDPYLARFNRRLSLPISRILLRMPVTANHVSLAIVVLGVYSGWVFRSGTYWTLVAAAFLSLAASVADGCDGEIARLKYQESAFGCWLDTAGDYVYYIAIFIGMTVGVVRYTGQSGFYYVGAALLGGVLLSLAGLIFLRHRLTAGEPEKLQRTAKSHLYARGSWFAWLLAELSFCATRSSMPYGLAAFALCGLLPAFLVLAAIGANIYWIGIALNLRPLVAEARRPLQGGSPQPN